MNFTAIDHDAACSHRWLPLLAIVMMPLSGLSAEVAAPTYGLAIHGGAGAIRREDLSPQLEAEYRAALNEALSAGYVVLERGGSALDAVVAAIQLLEDSPLFNAGKGAVLNADGICELDASIMEGRTLAAGAVAGVQQIKNPIMLAREVMEKTEHVILIGAGAERFAQQLGYELVPNDYFQTDRRKQQLRRVQEAEQKEPRRKGLGSTEGDLLLLDRKWGTVGCVALDRQGNLAAGTSTGGMTNKKFGRVGDSPIIGAGTYANNATCALSATGHGEYFIRTAVAHDVSAQMEYKGSSLAEASAATLAKVERLGGTGGMIAIDRRGNVSMPFNTAGMYRGFRLSTGASEIAIFGASPPSEP